MFTINKKQPNPIAVRMDKNTHSSFLLPKPSAFPSLPKCVGTIGGRCGQINHKLANGMAQINKNELWVFLSILTAIGFGCFLLIVNIHKIDPKKSMHSVLIMKKIAFATLILIAFIECLIVNSSSSGVTHLDKLIVPVLGLFFAFLGSTFSSLQPNYFVGIRTPWTLENEKNWKATHKLASKLWIAGGLLAIPLSLFLPFEIAIFSFIGITLIICIIPFVFSYRLFKKGNPTAK